MSWVALLVALGAVAWTWWRTRETGAGRGVVDRPADDGAGPTLEERVDALEVHAQGSNITHRGLREDVSHHADRLDALESADAPDVEGLRERVSALEEEVSQLDREMVTAFKRATSALGNSEQAIVGLWHAWSTCPATLEAEPEDDYSEGGCVVYHHAGDEPWESVVEAARSEYHDVAHSPELRLLAVHFDDPESARETLAGADRVYTRRRLNRIRVGASQYVGDHTDWRNEASDD